MTLCHLLGIDGSGKTTLAKALVDDCQRAGRRTAYFYAQHEPRLLAPMKWFAQRAFVAGATGYRAYSERKTTVSRRHPLLAYVYVAVWIVDYVIATQMRLARYRFREGCLVVDRYYPDVVINMAQAAGLDEIGQARLVDLLSLLLPRACVSIWIDVEEEIAFSRKSDVADIEYLRERRIRYRSLARQLHAETLDGARDVDELRAAGARVVDAALAGRVIEARGAA